MSLLSNFLGTEEFSLMDSPMFQELVENIKANKIYSVNNEFDYDLNISGSLKKYKYYLEVSSPGIERDLRDLEEVTNSVGKHVYIKTYEKVDNQKEFYDLNSITKVNVMPKYNIKNKKSCFSYLPIDSENLITTKENSEVAA